jgi:hypothetical protein
MINYKDFPVVSMDEYEGIVIDAHQSKDGYTPSIHFVKQFWNPDAKKKSKRRAEGFVMVTYMTCKTLEELHAKISMMIEIGFFNNTQVSAYGNLWNESDEVVSEIDWQMIGDNIEWANEDITDLIIDSSKRTLH